MMSKFGYLARIVRRMDFSRMREKAGEVSELSGKARAAVLFDMAWCGLRYQAGYMDYALFRMYEKNAAQRGTILTRGKNNMYVASLNDPAANAVFDEKPAFHRVFKEFTRRDFLDLSESSPADLARFVEEHGDIVAKPPAGTHGDGIRRIIAADITDATALFGELKAGGQFLCEELVRQHEGMERLNPHAVNTVRTLTMLKDGVPNVAAAYLRIGGVGSGVDNFNNGGMVVPVGIADGAVSLPAVDKAGNVYTEHPATGCPIDGFVIPMWDKCLDLVKKAALVMPSVRYVGWDVAVTPTGPLLIEGNCFPGHDIYGLPPHSPDGKGILPQFEAIIPMRELKRMRRENAGMG